MEMWICRLGILMLGISFSLFASFVRVPVFAQQEFPPPSPPPSPPPPPPPPPLLMPHPVWTLSPPPPTPIWSSPPPPTTMKRNHQPPNRRNFRRKLPPKQHKLNSGQQVGLLFIAIAGTLQLFVAGILIFLRRQVLKVKDRYENVE